MAILNTIKKLLLLVVLLGGIGPSFAANEVMRDDPKRPVDKISKDLGIQPEQFRQCFSNVSPAPAGQRPESDRTQANKAVLLSCLQKANPAITNDSLDTVMDRYRPGGREAQMPPGRS
jgi:hypothetical protein